MKKVKTKFCIFFIFSFIPLFIFSQNWLPLDKGLGHPYATIYHVMPDSNNIYAIGYITADGHNNPLRCIAKWNSIKWDTVGDNNIGICGKDGICKFRDTLLVSGYFHNTLNAQMAKWNGLDWDTISNTNGMDVKCFLEKDSVLYLGGYFYKCGNDPTNLVGKYDGTTFSGMTPVYENTGSSSVVLCMAFFQDTLYIGGVFYLYPNVNAAGFAKWDGHNLLPVSPEFSNNTCIIETMAVYKNELYIGGEFYKSGGFTGDCIMKWDGHQFTEVGGGTNQRVTCMKVYNNELYVGGWFTSVGCNPCNNIAKWDGNQWTCLNDEAFDEFYCIRDICIMNDELYIAGDFRKIGNDSINSIAKYKYPLTSCNEYKIINNKIVVYPNPTQDEFFVEYSGDVTGQVLTTELYNIYGAKIKEAHISNKNSLTVSAKDLPAGIYFYGVKVGNNIVGKNKIVISK
jgi:hypothetical protein